MSVEAAHNIIDSYNENIKDQITYLRTPAHNWTGFSSIKSRVDEYGVHIQLLNSILDKIKYIVKEAGDDILEDKKIKGFVKSCTSIFNYHDQITKDYFSRVRIIDLIKIEDKTDEITFQDRILKDLIKINESLRQINILDEGLKKDIKLKTYGDQIFSIPNMKNICLKYPNIDNLVKEKLNYEPNFTD